MLSLVHILELKGADPLTVKGVNLSYLVSEGPLYIFWTLAHPNNLYS